MLLDQKQIKNLAQKLPVKAVTTDVLPANTYANGSSGFGATLTGNANGALPAQDGVTLVTGDRLLVKNEVASENNGIYVVTQVGSVGTPYILTRANDCNTAEKIFSGISTKSTADGIINSRKDWELITTISPIVVGTTAVSWGTVISDQVPTSSNKNMAASATNSDFQVATATSIAATPADNSYVQVFVNGTKQVLGDGVKTKDCYFSADGGVTARLIADITAGDLLYWVGSVAGFELATSDSIDFDYNT